MIKRFETYVEAVDEAAKYGCQVFSDYDTDGGVMICGPEITTAIQIPSRSEAGSTLGGSYEEN